MNIANLLKDAAEQHPHGQALIFEGRVWQYSEVEQAAARLAGWMHQHGIKRADRVALYLPNVPEFVIAYYASLKLGAIVVSINSMLTTREVDYVLQDSGARLVFTVAESRDNVTDATVDVVIVDQESLNTDDHSLFEILTSCVPRHDIVECSEDTAAAILYTSGTTGFPKGAVLSHHNVLSNVEQTVHCTKIER